MIEMIDTYQMEETGFKIEVQSEIKRKIKIIQLLFSEKRWYTFEEISKTVHISTKTISSDLSFINDNLPCGWNIKIKKGYGVQLFIPMNASLMEIRSSFFKKSLTFQILRELLIRKQTTAIDIAEDLYIQPYMLSKMFNKIEKDISYFDLYIQRKPIKIVGTNWNVIHMFLEVYLKAYLGSKWPFEYNKAIIFQFIQNVEDRMKIVLYLSCRRKLSYFIAILLIRKQQGYEFQWKNTLLTSNIDTPFYKKISISLKELEKKYGVNFSNHEKIALTIMFKTSNYIYKFPSKEKKIDLRHFHEQKKIIYILLREFINMLDRKLNCNLINDMEFIYSIIIYFRKKIYVLEFLTYLEHVEKPSTQYAKKKYPKTFLQVRDVYNQWVKKHHIAPYVSDEEIANIVIYIEATRIRNNIAPKKVMLITESGDMWKSYISAILKKEFGDKIHLLTNISLNISKGKDLEKTYDTDFIISTIPLKSNSHPVIQIQPSVTERDIINIRCFINE